MRSPDYGLIPGLPEHFGCDFALELFRKGSFSHEFENAVQKIHEAGHFRIPIYLSIGTEFNGAVFSMLLQGCNIFAQHRCHSLYLSLGGNPESLRDELLGLPSGCARGMAGSNAIQSDEANMYGHSGLMGEQIPIAVGAALASNKLTLAICGDASVEEDYIYPALGFAATKKLPILFICEDNDLSILTKTKVRRNWEVVDLANSLGIPAVDITDDPWLIAHHIKSMLTNLPGFINIRTVRHLWHAGSGTDGAPEWDRYQLIKDELSSLGLNDKIRQIEQSNFDLVQTLWQKQLQTLSSE